MLESLPSIHFCKQKLLSVTQMQSALDKGVDVKATNSTEPPYLFVPRVLFPLDSFDPRSSKSPAAAAEGPNTAITRVDAAGACLF